MAKGHYSERALKILENDTLIYINSLGTNEKSSSANERLPVPKPGAWRCTTTGMNS